jgi:cob(I)alamin adenosyltransferase
VKHRISRVTTRGGDTGKSSLADGSRLNKTDAVFAAIGDVDELNCFVGLLVTELEPDSPFAASCQAIQQSLFDIGASLATRGVTPAPDAELLESEVAKLNAELPPLTEFVLPGGSRSAAAAHVCRSVCRRAERSLWALPGSDGEETAACARYLNRLSDFFFVLARSCNAGSTEQQWRGSKR